HHRPDPETPLEETMTALDHIVRQGKALYVGISNYDAGRTHQAAEFLESLGTPCLIHQPKYNMFDRWVEDRLLETLRIKGIGCIAFSPLAQGLLTSKYLDGIPRDSRAASSHGFLKPDEVTQDKVTKARRLNELAQKRGQSLAQLAVVWILRHPEMTSVLIGASKINQIEENVDALKNKSFSESELKQIEQTLA
ncbi:aldo/keto reductase, partial [candidate division KSB1 bacterium]|nr:aldo/keto reductase [candidate division KSB1 bacterium]